MTSAERERTIQLEIGGMTCASCVGAVEKAVRSLPGITQVAVNLATGDARIVLDPIPENDSPTSSEIDAAEVVEAIQRAGYTARVLSEESHDRPDFAVEESDLARSRFFLSLAGTVPTAVAMWGLGMTPASLTIQGLGALFVLAIPGRHYFTTSWFALRRGHATMDTLIALGAGTAFVASTASTFGALGEGAPIFFETAAFLITFISLGKWLESRARGEARAALRSLLDLAPPTARRIENGQEREVPAAEIGVGDRIVVLAGERIPADGVVRAGTTVVDESLLTGESIPVEKVAWDDVTGGTVNEAGRIEVEVTATGGATVLAGIVRMVREAQAHPAPVQKLADRVSGVFVPVVIALSLATLITWLAIDGDVAQAIRFAVSVVVIACPCALGLATPTAILVGSGIGLRRGILIKNAGALEALARAKVLFLDKTGTLTEGKFSLDTIECGDGFTEDEILGITAAIERGSTHPIARAVVETAKDRKIALPELDGVEEVAGLGLRGSVGGRSVIVGRREFLSDAGVQVPSESERETSRVLLAVEGTYAGTLHWIDAPRPRAKEVVEALKTAGLELVLLTGDRRRAAERIAAEVGISRVEAEVRPGEKQEHVRAAQAGGTVVAMVGDGINDAPALAAADVGIAIGAGADAAKESGGVVLVRSDLVDLLRARRLARATFRKVRSNLFWAFAYNMIGLPVAAGVFSSFGVILRPELAGLAMALSSVSVVGNSLLLRRQEARIFA